MSYTFVESGNDGYVTCASEDEVISREDDFLDLIAACGEYRTGKVLLRAEDLSDAFFDLKTKFAGALFQKLANYHIVCAVVMDIDAVESERFQELIREANKGNAYRFFADADTAGAWLGSLP